MARYFILASIYCYQALLSPDHSILGRIFFPHGCCRFYPSCSAYAQEAVAWYGIWYGLWFATWRLLRCHPWSRGGFDPVRGSVPAASLGRYSFNFMKQITRNSSHGGHYVL